MPLPVVIPAAGLGSRLGALTRDCPKELLTLGGQPVLHGAGLELEAAGITDAVVVTSPSKPGIDAWARAHDLRTVVQPAPLGVFDAVARARIEAPRFVVLFPDFVHLPDQTALRTLLVAAEAVPAEASVYGIVRRAAAHAVRMGPAAHVSGVGDGLVQIARVGPAQPTGLHTTFAELRGTAHSRRLAGGDDGITDLLQGLADDGLLYGVELPGTILDIGIPAGYADAAQRFAHGARWRR